METANLIASISKLLHFFQYRNYLPVKRIRIPRFFYSRFNQSLSEILFNRNPSQFWIALDVLLPKHVFVFKNNFPTNFKIFIFFNVWDTEEREKRLSTKNVCNEVSDEFVLSCLLPLWVKMSAVSIVSYPSHMYYLIVSG